MVLQENGAFSPNQLQNALVIPQNTREVLMPCFSCFKHASIFECLDSQILDVSEIVLEKSLNRRLTRRRRLERFLESRIFVVSDQT